MQSVQSKSSYNRSEESKTSSRAERIKERSLQDLSQLKKSLFSEESPVNKKLVEISDQMEKHKSNLEANGLFEQFEEVFNLIEFEKYRVLDIINQLMPEKE